MWMCDLELKHNNNIDLFHPQGLAQHTHSPQYNLSNLARCAHLRVIMCACEAGFETAAYLRCDIDVLEVTVISAPTTCCLCVQARCQ